MSKDSSRCDATLTTATQDVNDFLVFYILVTLLWSLVSCVCMCVCMCLLNFVQHLFFTSLYNAPRITYEKQRLHIVRLRLDEINIYPYSIFYYMCLLYNNKKQNNHLPESRIYTIHVCFWVLLSRWLCVCLCQYIAHSFKIR